MSTTTTAPPARARRARGLTAEDLALWRHAVRDVRPVGELPPPPPFSAPPPPAPAPVVLPAAPPAPAPVPPRRRDSQRLDPKGPVDIDRRSWLRLRRGLYPVEARLDLHGMTQAQAHDALTGFVALAHGRGQRCVLVITGRGLGSGGTLRAMTPRWLDEPPNRERVLSYAPAQLRHGGDGALYVLLRRRA
ncbi:MAG: Smr/MutS family protein [Geminicoccaceae bacterium]